MRFAVLGAGAIGAYVGARLIEGGSEVVLIARGAHLEAMRRRGLKVISDRGDLALRVEATDELEAVSEVDTVIVALKAYSLPAVAPRLGELLAPGTATIWAQNGIPWWYFHRHGGPLDALGLESVDPGGVIASSLSRDDAIGAVVYCSAELEGPGVVRHVEGTRLTLGEPDGTLSARCATISDALRAGGLRAPVVADLRAEIWLKLLGNATFNPISALTGATLRELGELADMRTLLLEAFREIAALAHALGLTLSVSPERRLEAGFAVGDHKTSMLQDLEAGRPLEYQCMSGAVLEIARRLDIEVPRIEALHACVALLDRRHQASSEADRTARRA